LNLAVGAWPGYYLVVIAVSPLGAISGILGLMNTPSERAVPHISYRSLLVDFEKPPVVETSLGFYFQKIEGWNLLHYGSFGEKLRAKYPKVQFLPALMEAPFNFQLPLNFVAVPPIRVCFVDATQTQLTQVQDTLFLHNWRKAEANYDYQHYHAILPMFIEDWRQFLTFLSERDLKRPIISRCEMTYFNHLIRGADWNDYSDLPDIFPAWNAGALESPASKPSTVAFSMSHAIPSGSVSFAVQPGVREADGKEIIQLTVTASVYPSKQEDSDIFECLSACHENAVKGFVSFTAKKMHRNWKRKT
jgi:uncharacterized protein (TIGR04255 family)